MPKFTYEVEIYYSEEDQHGDACEGTYTIELEAHSLNAAKKEAELNWGCNVQEVKRITH